MSAEQFNDTAGVLSISTAVCIPMRCDSSISLPFFVILYNLFFFFFFFFLTQAAFNLHSVNNVMRGKSEILDHCKHVERLVALHVDKDDK